MVLALVAIDRFQVHPLVNHEIVAAVTTIAIVRLAFGPASLVSLDSPLFDFVGKISFGIYIYHPLVIFALAGATRQVFARSRGRTSRRDRTVSRRGGDHDVCRLAVVRARGAACPAVQTPLRCRRDGAGFLAPLSTRTTAILVCAFAALIPLGWPGLPFNMQPADLLFPIVAAALVLGRPALSSHRLDLLVVIYLAGSALSIPGSLSVRESSIALVKELYLAAVYLALRVAVPVGPRRICRWLVRGAAATAALSLAAAAVFYVTGHTALRFGEPMPLPYVGQVFRTRGTLEAPEFFGNLLTFVMPLALLFAMEAAEARWRAIAVVALLASAELLTFSKSLGGCALAVTVLLWPRLLAHPWLKTAAVAATAGLIVAFNVAAIVTIRKADVRFAKDSNVPVPNYVYARQDDPAGADRVDLGVTVQPDELLPDEESRVARVSGASVDRHRQRGVSSRSRACVSGRPHPSGVPASQRALAAVRPAFRNRASSAPSLLPPFSSCCGGRCSRPRVCPASTVVSAGRSLRASPACSSTASTSMRCISGFSGLPSG